MNKSKRKLIISMLVMMFVLLSAVSVVAIAFALTQQTITTTLNITYKVEDVFGTASAKYTIGTTQTSLKAYKNNVEQTDNVLLFDESTKLSDSHQLSFPTESVSLTSENRSMVIDYTYTNKGARPYCVELNINKTNCTNISIKCSADGTTYQDNDVTLAIPVEAKGTSDTVKHYYVKIEVIDSSKNASCSPTFTWTLEGKSQEEIDEMGGAQAISNKVFSQTAGSSYSASLTSLGTGDYVGVVSYPNNFNGTPVTTISASTLSDVDKAKVTSVRIPASVTAIDNEAFSGFTNLRTVTFDQNSTSSASVGTQSSSTGLTDLGHSVFADCTSLTQITLPSSLKNVSQTAFRDCTNLVTVDCSATFVGMAAFYNCTNLRNFPFENLTEISVSAFEECKSLSSIKFSNLTTIPMTAFSGCTALTSIELPESLISLDTMAFLNCPNLTNITVADGNTKFYSVNNCVVNNSKLLVLGGVNATIPDDGSVTSIGGYVFANRNFSTLTIPDSVTHVDAYAFDNCQIDTLIIGDGLTEIGLQTFLNAKNITIGENVTKIQAGNFEYCESVTFANPNGWYVSTNYPATSGTNLTSTALSDTSTAATYFNSTYKTYYWFRSAT